MRPSLIPQPVDCAVAPPSRESTLVRALHRACLILGGTAPLAVYLGVAQADLLKWMQGQEEPPYEVFLAAVEIILLNVEAPGRAT